MYGKLFCLVNAPLQTVYFVLQLSILLRELFVLGVHSQLKLPQVLHVPRLLEERAQPESATAAEKLAGLQPRQFSAGLGDGRLHAGHFGRQMPSGDARVCRGFSCFDEPRVPQTETIPTGAQVP